MFWGRNDNIIQMKNHLMNLVMHAIYSFGLHLHVGIVAGAKAGGYIYYRSHIRCYFKVNNVETYTSTSMTTTDTAATRPILSTSRVTITSTADDRMTFDQPNADKHLTLNLCGPLIDNDCTNNEGN